MAIDTLSSIHTVYTLQLSRQAEMNYLCGSDYFAASWEQALQVSQTLKTFNMVFREMNCGILPKWVSSVITFSPLLPASLTYFNLGNPRAKKTIIWITRHFGQTTQMINLLGITLLLFYGRYFVVLASLTTYAVSYMSEKKYFPDSVNKIIDTAIVIPMMLTF